MMESFSGYFKIMCAKATEVQRLWPELDRPEQEWDYCCPKGEYQDGIIHSLHMKELPKAAEKEFFANNIWLPQEFQIRERLFPRVAYRIQGIIKNLNDAYYAYWKSNKAEPFLNEHIQDREREHARALMFIMEYSFRKEWVDKNNEWESIASK